MKTCNLCLNTFLIISLFWCHVANARHQKCSYTHLSKTYNFKLEYNTARNRDSEEYISSVQLSVTTKSDNKLVQKIASSYSHKEAVSYSFLCTSRSFTTNYRKNAVVEDGDYGDVIVADFNFDGREDFALKTDQCPTGAGSETFDFYLQDKNGKFIKDKYLSTKVVGCPSKVNAKKHTLVLETPILVGTKLRIETFVYNTETGKWHKLKDQFEE